MFIRYQIKDVDEAETLREGIINSVTINHLELIEDIEGLVIYLNNQVLQFRFANKGDATIAFISFTEALQSIGTNHEFIKLTVIPNF